MTGPDVWDVIVAARGAFGREFLHLLMTGEAHLPTLHDSGADGPWDRVEGTTKGVRLWTWADGWATKPQRPNATWTQICDELRRRIDPAPLAALWETERATWRAYLDQVDEVREGWQDGTITEEMKQRDWALHCAHHEAEQVALDRLRALIESAPAGVPDDLGTPDMLDLLEVTS